MEESIKTLNNVIIGTIETRSNGDKIVREFPSRIILGYYKANLNVTTDLFGRIISKGDTAVQLLYK